MFIQPSTPSNTASSGSARPALTIASTMPIVRGWEDLTNGRRENLLSALAAVTRLAGTVPEAIALNCQALRPIVFGYKHRAHGLSDDRISNVRCDLRFILRRLGLHASKSPWRETLTPRWRSLIATWTDEYRLMRFGLFCRFASESGIAPEGVSTATFAAFESWCSESILQKSPAQSVRHAMLEWNWAVAHLPGWPSARLFTPGVRPYYTRPLVDFPAEFQAEVALYERHLSCDDPELLFSDDVPGFADGSPGLRRGARPATISRRLFQIRQAAAALLHSGRAISSIRSLRDLVDPPENPRAILTFFLERARQQQNLPARAPVAGQQLAGIAELLRQIAAFHVKLPPEDVARIAAWSKKLRRPRRTGMTAKNRQRLRAMVQPRNRAMVLHLPRELMRQADALLETRPEDAAGLALSAAALEILIICPLRISNLIGLRLDQHLQRIDPARTRRVSHFVIPEHEGKNNMPLEWPVPRESADLLERYITLYRPLIAPQGNVHLFPGKGKNARSRTGMSRPLCQPIKREIGIDVNPHLLRAFAGWNYLKDNPGAYETVRRILNHKSIETTVNFYCGLEAEFAAEHFDATVLRERKATRDVAAGAFRRNRTRVRAKR
jgi:integrase